MQCVHCMPCDARIACTACQPRSWCNVCNSRKHCTADLAKGSLPAQINMRPGLPTETRNAPQQCLVLESRTPVRPDGTERPPPGSKYMWATSCHHHRSDVGRSCTTPNLGTNSGSLLRTLAFARRMHFEAPQWTSKTPTEVILGLPIGVRWVGAPDRQRRSRDVKCARMAARVFARCSGFAAIADRWMYDFSSSSCSLPLARSARFRCSLGDSPAQSML
jgi:hypothetical protein